MRDSLIIYRSTFEASKSLSEKHRLKFFDTIFDYALNDIEPEGLSGNLKIFFDLTRPLIDSNNKKYKNGCKGGRPKDDDSPKKDLGEDNKLVNLTELQYDRLVTKFGEDVITLAVKELEDWLESGDAGISKMAKNALGKNHYCYFKSDKWVIQKSLKALEAKEQTKQPNWSI